HRADRSRCLRRAAVTEPFVLAGASQVVTNDSSHGGLAGVLANGAVVVSGSGVAWVGPEADLPSEWADARRIDLEGRTLIPGFVDAHTHLVFAGDRSDEFAQRMAGRSYQEIAAEGGGILATVEASRRAGFEELVSLTRRRMQAMLAQGTTTLEVKSGYGLSTEHELNQLRAAAAAASGLPITIRRTFLG